MWSIIFPGLSLVFSLMLYDAWKTGRVKAKGWGFAIRYYDRNDQPIMFWITTVIYAVIVIWSLSAAVMLAGR
ncbi:MAG: hypothetical protein PSX71_13745 [bacterium]|nr:hypothetical protein [bacterium]